MSDQECKLVFDIFFFVKNQIKIHKIKKKKLQNFETGFSVLFVYILRSNNKKAEYKNQI